MSKKDKKVEKKAPVKVEKVKRNLFSKADIISSVAEMNDLSKRDAEDAVNAVFEVIAGALNENNDIQIHQFGKFSLKDMPSRTARNPKTGGTVDVPATVKVTFKPALNLKNSVKELV